MKWFVVIWLFTNGQPTQVVGWDNPFNTRKACEAWLAAGGNSPGTAPGFESAPGGGILETHGKRRVTCAPMGVS